jgi:hypothetical protein
MSAGRPPLRARPAPRGLRRVERWLVGLVMAILAFVIEKAVLRSIKKGDTKPKPQAPATTTLTGAGAQISAE